MTTIDDWKEYELWSQKYESVVSKLSSEQRQKILNLQASNSYANPDRQYSYDALDYLFTHEDDFPKTTEDMILYRGGYIGPRETRRFVSASVFRSVAEEYAGTYAINKIIVKKGSLLLPLRAVHVYAGNHEGEVIIATKFVNQSLYKTVYWYVPDGSSVSLSECVFAKNFIK